MFKTSYLHEVRKEKYERSDVFEDDDIPEGAGSGSPVPRPAHGWESLQDLNGRFARYINRARVLEQRNAIFRKQLETLQRMEEATGLEEAFVEQISLNRQRIRELYSDKAKLERDLKDAERMLDEFANRYKNECEYQAQLRDTLEHLNKEADNSLLRNLEYQIQTQFLQDDINSTKDRHKKNLAEIQTYVNILQQINQTTPLLPNMGGGMSEDKEKRHAQRQLPALQIQLEEYKSALCQLQGQRQRLQTETSVLEQTIKSTQDNYNDEIQLYNKQIEGLRKDIEAAERSLEKYTNDSKHLAVSQSSLENELERYKRIIENEDNRLHSAIIGTPVTLFATNYRFIHNSPAPRSGKDITQVMQDITSVKTRQKNHQGKKVNKKRELSPRDVMMGGSSGGGGGVDGSGTSGVDHMDADKQSGTTEVEWEARRENVPLHHTHKHVGGVVREDVPDGAQISKAFDTLCNIVRDRMRRYKKPEPIADFYTKGRYVLVTGDSSYQDPCFYTSSPSGGHVFVTICDGMLHPYDPYGPVGPIGPVGPVGPIGPIGPIDPPGPVGPIGPIDPPGPVGPIGPIDPPGPPVGPVGPVGPIGPKGTFGPTEPSPDDDHPSPPPPPVSPHRPSPSDNGHDKEGKRRNGNGGGGGGGGGGGKRNQKSKNADHDPNSRHPGHPGGSQDPSSQDRNRQWEPRSRVDIPPGSVSYEKVEVVESVERLSPDNKVKGYEETSMIVETTIEKTSKKKHGDQS